MTISDKTFQFATPITVAAFKALLKGRVKGVQFNLDTHSHDEDPESDIILYVGGEALSLLLSDDPVADEDERQVTGLCTSSGGNFYSEEEADDFEIALDDTEALLTAKGIHFTKAD